MFGLDMGLSERDAAILADELGDRGAAVGMPRALGGLPYDELGVTGFGVAEAADAAAQAIGLSLAGARIAIQGFGAVGQAAALRLQELGATVVAVSTARGAVIDPDGVDVRTQCLVVLGLFERQERHPYVLPLHGLAAVAAIALAARLFGTEAVLSAETGGMQDLFRRPDAPQG